MKANSIKALAAGLYHRLVEVLSSGKPETNTQSDNDIHKWKQVAAIVHEALPDIDRALGQENVPLFLRKLKAFDLIHETMLDVSDRRAFMLSDAHGRLLIVVENWYRDRYGDAIDDQNDAFDAALTIHGTPFTMRVPRTFKTRAEEPDHVWMGFPAKLQPEEDPLSWIIDRAVVKRLSADEREGAVAAARAVADQARSIGFDLRSLQSNSDPDISALAATISSDMQSSAHHICALSPDGPRQSGWSASQAVEKALKLFIRRRGAVPRHTHDLVKLANDAEALGLPAIDRQLLSNVPSNRKATDLRYSGDTSLAVGLTAYSAALAIVSKVAYEARPDEKFNIRNARFLLKRPPWFDFDTDGFSEELRKKDEGEV